MPTPTPPPRVSWQFPEDYLTNELWPAYYRAFGEFINAFGQAETTLAFHLEEFTEGLLGGGTGDERESLMRNVLRALLGSKRTTELAVSFNLCISAWQKSGEKFNPEALDEIRKLFAQLGEIRFLRDRTAHYGVHVLFEVGSPRFSAANRYTVNDIERTEQIIFTIEQIEGATDDVRTIGRRLPFVLGMHKRGEHPDPTNPHLLPQWRYKPGELKKRAVRFPPSNSGGTNPPSAWWKK